MPIFSYFAGMGSVLLALLFVADATLEKSAPVRVTAFAGLPTAYEHKNNGTSLAAMPAPAPDMSSDAVKAAAVVTAPAVAVEIAPKKKKNIVLRQKQDDSRQNFAWSRNDSSFGGKLFVGRF
jgi:hypothetical protein